MNERLDPLDESKEFGQHLNGLLRSTIELEASDFEECMYNSNYDEDLTESEKGTLAGWISAWQRMQAGDP